MNDGLFPHLLRDWYLAHVLFAWLCVVVVAIGVSGWWYIR